MENEMILAQQEHPGCYNREPLTTHYLVKDGLSYIMNPDGTGVAAYKIKTVPFVGDMDCHSDEPRCKGCKWL